MSHQGAHEPIGRGLAFHSPGVPTTTGWTANAAGPRAGGLGLGPIARYACVAPQGDVTLTDTSQGEVA
jgi:hypothetical protein